MKGILTPVTSSCAMVPRYSSSPPQTTRRAGSISTRYRRRLATNSSRNPPSAARVLPDGIIMDVERAPATLRLVPRRAPQIALSPDGWTPGSSLRSPSLRLSRIDSPGLSRDVGKRPRLRPVPSPSLARGPPDSHGGSAPTRQPGPNHPHSEKQTGLARRLGGHIAALKDQVVARTLAGW